MRLLSISIILSLLVSPSLGAQARVCSIDKIPLDKRAEPTVEYHVIFLEQNNVRDLCGFEWAAPMEPVWGCASNNGDGTWNIYAEKRMDEANRECVIMHEKAHLPPNLWVHADTFRTIPGGLYRRKVQFQEWRDWAYAQPKVKPITYD